VLQALTGNVAEARELTTASLAAARERDQAWTVIRSLGLLGFIDLSLGDAVAASKALDEAVALCEQVGVAEPGIFRTHADAVESLVAAGRLDRAEQVLAAFERDARAVERPWALAAASRCRALVLAARREHAEALDVLDDALARASALGQPFEEGRTLLVAGTIRRRAGQKREARRLLSEATDVFDRLGARLWAERARAELGRIAGRAPGGRNLTPSESQVAELVSAGLSNREVAERLFIAVRTVETNLTRIYDKLGVSSRTQLARQVAEERARGSQDEMVTPVR
jgi:DNA-binding NarL/FixJ family response regulator